MNKKIAVIFDGNLVDIKGQVNAIINRIKYLQQVADYEIDVYTIQPYHKGLERLIWGEYISGMPDTMMFDGVTMNVLWYRLHAIDNLFEHRFHKKPPFVSAFIKSIIDRFSSYDILSVHSFLSGALALKVYQRYNIPYFISWHGSEIHSIPIDYRYQFETTRDILKNARCNFFVSKSLSESARKIEKDFFYEILYNGYGNAFYRYSDEIRKQLRQEYDVENCKVVSFVGNLKPVKNAQLLPEVFAAVAEKYQKPIRFWIIGDGVLRSVIEEKLNGSRIDCKLWGNQPSQDIPRFLQCVDVQILISNNEGFGLSLIEALACGVNAVGSRVGGINEVLGEDNTFELGSSFIENISNKIVYYLNSKVPQKPMVEADWKTTAEKENNIYHSVME